MARSKSSTQWLQRHVSDPFVQKAKAQGLRSRAAFKLQEIDEKDRLLRPGMRVVDLGAAPGSWSQYAAKRVGPAGKVVAIDLLEIAPSAGVTVLRGDFLDPAMQSALRVELGGAPADVVLCDLSPNLSGIASADQARAAGLAEEAIAFCRDVLAPGGAFLVKVFQGGEFRGLHETLKRTFATVQTRKPAASRGESRETYLLCRGLRGA
jgi:23S rRNA (uridine2552-2'-O)-methyltransferase